MLKGSEIVYQVCFTYVTTDDQNGRKNHACMFVFVFVRKKIFACISNWMSNVN